MAKTIFVWYQSFMHFNALLFSGNFKLTLVSLIWASKGSYAVFCLRIAQLSIMVFIMAIIKCAMAYLTLAVKKI